MLGYLFVLCTLKIAYPLHDKRCTILKLINVIVSLRNSNIFFQKGGPFTNGNWANMILEKGFYTRSTLRGNDWLKKSTDA